MIVSLLLARVGFTQSNTGCNGQPATGKLQVSITSLNASTGVVQVNGVDTRVPNTLFIWAWGDGATTQGFFPQSHTYSNLQQNYTLQVTSHENDGSSDCAQLAITFVTPPPATEITGGLSFLPPAWQPIGPIKIPNAHACDNTAEASLFAAGRIQAFAINLANHSVMYAGGGVGTGNSGPASNAGVYKSTDGGVHWDTQDNGLTDRYVGALWLGQSNPSTLVASTWFGGIFWSTDAAQSWTNVRPPSTSVTSIGPGTAPIVQIGSGLLVAAADGVVASTDSGATWTLQKATSKPIRTLACGGGACYAGLDDDTILTQQPSGSWSTVLPGGSAITAYNIAVNPVDPTEAIVVRNNAGSLENMITRNAGATWSPFNSPPQQQSGGCSGGPAKVLAFDTMNPNTVYGGFGGAMWASTNGGASWRPLHMYDDLNLVYPFPGQSENLVVGGDQGIYMSQDVGATWTSLNGDLPTSLLTHLAINGTEIFPAVQDFSPIQSFDGGLSWIQLSGANPPVGEDGVVVINPGNTQYQYVFNGVGLQYSTDGGKNFTNDSANLRPTEWGFNGTTDYIAIDRTSPEHLYLVGTSGIFESLDYGVHWRPTG